MIQKILHLYLISLRDVYKRQAQLNEKPQKVEVTGVKVTRKIKIIIGIAIVVLILGGVTIFEAVSYTHLYYLYIHYVEGELYESDYGKSTFFKVWQKSI